MRVTRKQIAKAIKEETGLDGEIFIGDGMAYFYSDIDSKLNNRLLSIKDNYVMLCRLNIQSVDEWVSDFKNIIGVKFIATKQLKQELIETSMRGSVVDLVITNEVGREYSAEELGNLGFTSTHIARMMSKTS